MPILDLLVPLLAVISGALAIRFDYRGPRIAVFVLRPLTIILIILIPLLEDNPISASYRGFIVGGLLCSLAGDVFMILPRKKFLAGLLSFLAGHLFYIIAFRPAAGRPVAPGTLFPFVILALLMFRMLAPSLGKLKFPVFLYLAAITSMAWLAADRFIDSGDTKTLLAFAGSLLFLVSDAILGYNRFVKKFRLAQLFILATYFPAQLLIAMSV